MTSTPRPVPRPVPQRTPAAASAPALDLTTRLEAAAALPLEERAVELASIHETLASRLRQTQN
ncbi:hypothetical protein SAMN05216355_10998 [Actinomyces ruminicola]|uniref:Uncharacterized protein n=1 Tax=Actinomyces ruminicola TaxID=332524 RepID=A0A1H0D961_9ACTO|nr:hypothetical protein [Actinomyces ruminicola]SDN66744.1 hypothetical protein SAMN05216355_10998 [Actinomyces ruminicola]